MWCLRPVRFDVNVEDEDLASTSSKREPVKDQCCAPASTESVSSKRENNATRCTVHDGQVVGEGSFKQVFSGTYTEGDRTGQAAVVKELIDSRPYTASAFDHDIAVSMKAAEIVEQWNANGFLDKKIKINMPEVWTYLPGTAKEGLKVLVEPFIENFEKFNSNTGWVPEEQRRWTEVMQALSHFSYHISNGRTLLCDVQGAEYKDCVVLTDPAVLSTDRRYGPTDLGRAGMYTFFHMHRCNQFCRHEWRRPVVTAQEYPVRYGTSMVEADGQWIMPTRETRPSLPSVSELD